MKRDQLFSSLPANFTHKEATVQAHKLSLNVSKSDIHSWIAVWRFKGLITYNSGKYRKAK